MYWSQAAAAAAPHRDPVQPSAYASILVCRASASSISRTSRWGGLEHREREHPSRRGLVRRPAQPARRAGCAPPRVPPLARDGARGRRTSPPDGRRTPRSRAPRRSRGAPPSRPPARSSLFPGGAGSCRSRTRAPTHRARDPSRRGVGGRGDGYVRRRRPAHRTRGRSTVADSRKLGVLSLLDRVCGPGCPPRRGSSSARPSSRAGLPVKARGEDVCGSRRHDPVGYPFPPRGRTVRAHARPATVGRPASASATSSSE